MPTLSLCVPCYNAARYLPEFLRSVRDARPGFDEVLFLDDGSADDTSALLRASGFAPLGDGRNRGPGAARNALAAAARGGWLHFHDVDDPLPPELGARLKRELDGPEEVVVGGLGWVSEGTNEPLLAWDYADAAGRHPVEVVLSRSVLVGAAAVRRPAFFRVNGFDERHRCWEDADLFLRLAAAGAGFRWVPGQLAVSVRHDRGASGSAARCNECRQAYLTEYAGWLAPGHRPALRAAIERHKARCTGAGQTGLVAASERLLERLAFGTEGEQ